jgi:hypothetical protein
MVALVVCGVDGCDDLGVEAYDSVGVDTGGGLGESRVTVMYS